MLPTIDKAVSRTDLHSEVSINKGASFGPFGLGAEILIVALGALSVAAMFQDYAHFHRPEAVTLENVALKLWRGDNCCDLVHGIDAKAQKKRKGRSVDGEEQL